MDDFYDNDYECLPDGLKELLQHSVHKECGNCHEESGRLRVLDVVVNSTAVQIVNEHTLNVTKRIANPSVKLGRR